MAYKIALIKPKGPLNLGRRTGDLTNSKILPGSDQLFSALLNAYSLYYGAGETKAFFEALLEKPVLELSSLFPAQVTGEKVYYFVPKPLTLDLTPYFTDVKTAKKIEYLPVESLEKIAKGEGPGEGYVVQKAYLPVKQEYWHQSREIPRVALDRITSSSNIYYCTGITFAENIYLYFLYEIAPEWKTKFETALRVLADEGLGGERTYGFGQFSIEFREDFSWPLQGEYRFLLSNYYPKEDELLKIADGVKAYTLVESGGYVFSSFDRGVRKKSVRFFGPGSVFGFKPVGRLVDVTPKYFTEHPVYRYGYAFTLPWKGGI
ncbi:type III-A CRISPR-associated RAMP protein Csm4 [Carboxydothermus hydrogenoformans]|uniref:CRISPR system Cms protein Csm4 n=1 Tax=Carboxydothermus hydrogenoformans (strain ATCC BAA-161 / DSM 6008 / Z-2901) TaxID=246194 RepID=Q3AA79_CARHZ|nr:type III-A CRISPR-associated RAMP protein Csm4 [Carboxydothermus hydrogenoformans]ABB14943.1 CRISPR-associated RAMP protein, Csm4 family [Carboxydothermus hydrogenoformans Z-2901]